MTDWIQLDDVSEVVSKGTTPTSLGREFTNSGIPFLRAEDIQGGAIDLASPACHISPDTHSALSRSQLVSGDLLITIAGTLGRVGFIPETNRQINCNQAVAFVRLKRDLVDIRYACYACQSSVVLRPLLKQKKVGTIGNLNLEQLRGLRIPLPSLSEQRRIATILENADRLCHTRRYALRMSDTFLPSLFLELFGDLRETGTHYDQVPFGETVESTQLGLVRGAAETHPGFPFDYLRMDAIVGDGNLNLSGLKRVEATDQEVQDFDLRPGDFLFNTRNSKELVGKTALFKQRRGVVLFNNNIMRIRFKPGILPEFMMGLFQSEWLKQKLERVKSGTTSVFAIYYKDLADLPIVLPPLSLQTEFATLVERLVQLRSVHREGLRQADYLFQTLLHRAFQEESNALVS
jgi:type I restriction enzyme S subunit